MVKPWELLMVQPMLGDLFALKFFFCKLSLLDLLMGTLSVTRKETIRRWERKPARVGRGSGSSCVFFVSFLLPTGNLCCFYQLCPVGGSDSQVPIRPNLHSALGVLLEVAGF